MWSWLLWLSVGFVVGAVAVLAAEVAVVRVFISRLQHKTKQQHDKEKSSQERGSKSDPLYPRRSLEFSSTKEKEVFTTCTWIFISLEFVSLISTCKFILCLLLFLWSFLSFSENNIEFPNSIQLSFENLYFYDHENFYFDSLAYRS